MDFSDDVTNKYIWCTSICHFKMYMHIYIYKAVVVYLHCQEHFVRQSFGSNVKTVKTAEAEADREKGPLQQFCQDLHNKRRCCCVVQPVWMDTKLVQVQNVKRCKSRLCFGFVVFFWHSFMKIA